MAFAPPFGHKEKGLVRYRPTVEFCQQRAMQLYVIVQLDLLCPFGLTTYQNNIINIYIIIIT